MLGFFAIFLLFFFIIIISIFRALSRQVQNLIRREAEEEQWGEEAGRKSKVDVGEAGANEQQKSLFGFSVTPSKAFQL